MVMGIKDFALIIGLNGRPEISRKKLTRPTVSILEKYFEEKPVTLGALQYMFEAGAEILAKAPDEDVVKMAILYYIEKLIVSNQNKLKVNEEHLKLLYDDEELKKYPWGTISYEKTFHGFNQGIGSTATKGYIWILRIFICSTDLGFRDTLIHKRE
ncbi:hypothetical protein TIFTF001_010681 [Ficus carica]|uniref:DUF1985 domain-containing protein n=1 Tax=Ficus carica TaxID=3494 RepID=A0AA88DHQ9_FICCA|nr:hypothetical protein TIFTF001_010681 [Ficus carica]